MKDERSIKAIDVAIAFGEGKASREELDIAAAWSAAAASYTASYAASYAATANAFAAADAAARAAAYAASSAASAAFTENERLTADLCRKYLPIEVWNI
jgi:hypothetical protein